MMTNHRRGVRGECTWVKYAVATKLCHSAVHHHRALKLQPIRKCQHHFRIILLSTSYTNLPRISIFFLFFDFLTAITSDCELARVRLRCRLRQPRCIDADDCELATVRLRRRHQSNAVRYVHNLMNDEQIVNHNKPRPAHHYIIPAKSTSVPGEPTSTARSLTSVPDGLGSSRASDDHYWDQWVNM